VGLAEGWEGALSCRALVTPRTGAASEAGGEAAQPGGEGRKSKLRQEAGGRTSSSRVLICYSIPLGLGVV